MRRPRDEIAEILERDATLVAMFPDAEIAHLGDGIREARAPYAGMGPTREVRVVFRSQPSGDLHFEKICDGNVWRSLAGEIALSAVNERTTRIVLRMEGQTRSLVPEFSVRGPVREQLGELARALRERIDAA